MRSNRRRSEYGSEEAPGTTRPTTDSGLGFCGGRPRATLRSEQSAERTRQFGSARPTSGRSGLEHAYLNQESGEVVDTTFAHDPAVFELVEEHPRHLEALSGRGQAKEFADVG